ncbi:MAG: hypothetical protein V3U87_16265 [Methylococcaceae bacterium]
MINFMLDIFSVMFQINMRDTHEVPFAMPLLMACLVGGMVGFSIVRMIGNEKEDEREAREAQEVLEGRRTK